MALTIVWTRKAEEGYDEIINYLEEHFSEKEVRDFIRESRDFFDRLTEFPHMLARSPKRKHIRRGPINTYTILTYRIRPRKKEIELLHIRSSRKRPLQNV